MIVRLVPKQRILAAADAYRHSHGDLGETTQVSCKVFTPDQTEVSVIVADLWS